MNEREIKLAKNLVNISCKVQKGEHVLICGTGGATYELIRAIVKETVKAGGIPHVELFNPAINRELKISGSKEMFEARNEYDLHKLKMMDCWIHVNGTDNTYEMSDIPDEINKLSDKLMHDSFRYRVDSTRWVILNYPNGAFAQQAKMSKEAFTDYFYDVCCLDYSKMDKAMDSLKALMERTDKVRLVGKDTDLSFSIKGMPAIKCAGEMNIPDGEIYSAPVRNSVNGVIKYNTPSLFSGTVFDDITFRFENGKIIEAASNNTEKINTILDSDEGARYIGEFALGVNPYITKPMMNTLFDEKISGSFHFTPGAAYEECNNGNKSVIHWDLVFIQTPEYGGGEIYFDDVLIRKDGLFVLPELLGLNPENLK